MSNSSIKQHFDSLDYLDDNPGRMSWPAWLLIVGAGSAAIGYCGYLGDFVLAGSIAVVLATALLGFRIGLSRMVAIVAAITLAVMYAPQLGMTYESQFAQWFGSTGLISRIIAIGTIGIGISLLGTIVFSFILNKIVRSRDGLPRTNSRLGFLAGTAQGALTVLVVLGGVLFAEPMQLQLANQDAQGNLQRTSRSKAITETALAVADYTHESRLGPYIEKYNPFENCEPLKEFGPMKKFKQIQQSVQVLSDPQKINRLLNHPDIQKMKDRPEVKQAMASLMQDEEISRVLNSGTMNRSDAIELLSHPAVLELIDQPGFVEEASKLIQQSAGDTPGWESSGLIEATPAATLQI